MGLKSITVKLDLRNLDETITAEQIKNIHVIYENIGEGADWEEATLFEVVDTEETD